MEIVISFYHSLFVNKYESIDVKKNYDDKM